MDIANCLVSLGGDHGNTVPKFHVTAAEIAVLRAIHGDDAINDIEPIGVTKRSNREERARLVFTYGGAKIPNTQTPIVENMFPGVAARVFETLEELDLDDSFFKATGRLTAKSAPQPIAAAAEDPEAAPAHDADDAEADEGVGDDMPDASEFSDLTQTGEPENVLG